MMQSTLSDLIPYIYVLFFGEYVAMRIACGAVKVRERRVLCVLCPALLLLQGVLLALRDVETVRLLYPLLVHLPTALVFVLLLRVCWPKALVCIAVSYSLCQLLRWIGLVLVLVCPNAALSALLHLALGFLLLIALDRYCLSAVHEVISSSTRTLVWFGLLPVLYYLYEYFTLYTARRYAHILALNELLPTQMVLFFVLFVTAYQHELKRRRQMEQQADVLEMKLALAKQDIASLRAIEEQTAVYRHDLHHHLRVIDGFLAAGQPEQAAQYIREADSGISALSPVRYCENETLNLLLRAFAAKAVASGVRMTIRADVPAVLSLPDPQLCAMVANGLENALHAVESLLPGTERSIDFFCTVRQKNLLIQIENPFSGEILMRDGLPASQDGRRGYGCLSIRSIALRHGGDCLFEAKDHRFTLRIAVPLKTSQP